MINKQAEGKIHDLLLMKSSILLLKNVDKNAIAIVDLWPTKPAFEHEDYFDVEAKLQC